MNEGAIKRINCPLCHGPLAWLGQLGLFAWLRCVDCGIDVTIQADEDEESEEEKPSH